MSPMATSYEKSKVAKMNKKSRRQRRDRRKKNLEKKSHEYSKLCGADVCLCIRIRESGQVYIFLADATGFWSFLRSHLVCIHAVSAYTY